jgi:hypothetical protein
VANGEDPYRVRFRTVFAMMSLVSSERDPESDRQRIVDVPEAVRLDEVLKVGPDVWTLVAATVVFRHEAALELSQGAREAGSRHGPNTC